MKYTQRRIFLMASAIIALVISARAIQAQVVDPTLDSSSRPPLTTYLAAMPETSSSSGSSLTSGGTVTSNLNGFDIVIVPGAGLSSNTAALAAFNRAAAQWESRIKNPITVTINADLAPLGSGIIGSTNTVRLVGTYTEIRNQIVASAALEPDDGIVAFLPTVGQFNANLPTGYSFNGNLAISKANAKAAGFTGLDSQIGVSDATITFSSNFSFDYDNSNGVPGTAMDFETVAAHEIGHALGFFSEVDYIDQTSSAIDVEPTTLDLFRFAVASNPTGTGDFTTTSRDLSPNVDAVTDFGVDTWGIGTDFRMSTGLNKGDGRQASHWRDDGLTGMPYIGIMDPTLSFGQIEFIKESDFRALDLIGWDISPIPEPSTYALGFTGLAAIFWFRRKRAA